MWVDALGEEVQPQCDKVDVSGALTITKETAFDTISTRQVTQLRSSHRGAAVIMRVQAEQDIVPMVKVSRHPLNRVGIDIGGRHFHRGRKIDDNLALGSRFQHIQDLIAHIHSEFELCAGVALG